MRMCVFFCNFAPEMKTVTVLLIAGWFSVSAEKQVCFSPGNLQYKAEGTHQTADGEEKTGVWQFATNAWEEAQSPWLDKFAWATSGWDNTADDPDAKLFEPTLNTINNYLASDINCTGYGPSQGGGRSQDLTGNSANYDWGIFNAISNGGNEVGKWRTLLYSEWEYLFKTRDNASDLHRLVHIVTQTEDIGGLIILPDGWKGDDLKTEYTETEWQVLENAGAIFMPDGEYWTATGLTDNKNQMARALTFSYVNDEDPCSDPALGKTIRFTHLPVRLAKDYVDPATGVENIAQSERTTQKILRNGQLLVEHGEKLFNMLGQKVH